MNRNGESSDGMQVVFVSSNGSENLVFGESQKLNGLKKRDRVCRCEKVMFVGRIVAVYGVGIVVAPIVIPVVLVSLPVYYGVKYVKKRKQREHGTDEMQNVDWSGSESVVGLVSSELDIGSE